MEKPGRLYALLAFLLLAACGSGDSGDSSGIEDVTDNALDQITYPARLEFSGIGEHGIFDPSITRDPATDTLWMSYSAVETSTAWPGQNNHAVTTRLASSSDNGLTWRDLGAVVNDFLDVSLSAPAPNHAGTWHHEVSRLVHDPAARASQRWKLYWHQYLLVDGERRFEHGWIGYKYADTPENLVSASEHKLFAGFLYDSRNDVAGNSATGSPLAGSPIALDALHPDLNACAAFSEIGVQATDDAVYFSLVCPTASTEQRVVILGCSSPCDGTQIGDYSYKGSALNAAMASTLGYLKFSASEIFTNADASRTFLMVTPVNNTPFPNAYNGCLVFEFSGLDNATLVGGENPTLVQSVAGSSGSFNGACAYAPGLSVGILYSEAQIDFSAGTTEFQIYLSGVHPD